MFSVYTAYIIITLASASLNIMRIICILWRPTHFSTLRNVSKVAFRHSSKWDSFLLQCMEPGGQSEHHKQLLQFHMQMCKCCNLRRSATRSLIVLSSIFHNKAVGDTVLSAFIPLCTYFTSAEILDRGFSTLQLVPWVHYCLAVMFEVCSDLHLLSSCFKSARLIWMSDGDFLHRGNFIILTTEDFWWWERDLHGDGDIFITYQRMFFELFDAFCNSSGFPWTSCIA